MNRIRSTYCIWIGALTFLVLLLSAVSVARDSSGPISVKPIVIPVPNLEPIYGEQEGARDKDEMIKTSTSASSEAQDISAFGRVLTPPANDACANATSIGNVNNLAFSTVEATADGPGGYITSPNIWYIYTADCSGTVTVSLCGSSFDTRVRVFAGTACDFSTVVGVNDDFCDRQSSMTFAATTGEQFLIEVAATLTTREPDS